MSESRGYGREYMQLIEGIKPLAISKVCIVIVWEGKLPFIRTILEGGLASSPRAGRIVRVARHKIVASGHDR